MKRYFFFLLLMNFAAVWAMVDCEAPKLLDERDYAGYLRDNIFDLAKYYSVQGTRAPYLALEHCKEIQTNGIKTKQGIILCCDKDHVPCAVYYPHGFYRFARVKSHSNDAGSCLMLRLQEEIEMTRDEKNTQKEMTHYLITRIGDQTLPMPELIGPSSGGN